MYKIKFQNLKYNPKENGHYNFKKLKEIRARRGPKYYQQMEAQPLRTKDEEE